METKNSQPRYTDERQGTRIRRTFSARSARGEEIVVDFSRSVNDHGRYALPRRWREAGLIDREPETWWSVTVYAEDEEGNCRGRYNPTEKPGGYGRVWDFEWLMEATEENLEKLSREIERRAGITA